MQATNIENNDFFCYVAYGYMLAMGLDILLIHC